jgi:plasmid maintenance system antidote protein VapI
MKKSTKVSKQIKPCQLTHAEFWKIIDYLRKVPPDIEQSIVASLGMSREEWMELGSKLILAAHRKPK